MLDHIKQFSDRPWGAAAYSYTRTTVGERYGFHAALEHPTAIKHHKMTWSWLLDNTPDVDIVIEKDAESGRRKRNKVSSDAPNDDVASAAGSAAGSAGAGGEDRSSPRNPEWATFQRDAHTWYHELTRAGVDDKSCRVLFLLSQHSDRGWQEANRIIHKIFKNTYGKSTVKGFDNVSAFVSKAVNNARRQLDHEDWYAKGWRW